MKPVIITLLLSIAFALSGQNRPYEFHRLMQEGDSKEQVKFLEDWEKEAPEDPEFFTACFSYYFTSSRQELSYDTVLFEKGISKISEGIALHPARLDMRFGKIYALGEVKDWTRFSDEIRRTIHFSARVENKWVWTMNQPWEGGEEEFLAAIQSYQMQLFATSDNQLNNEMRSIALAVLLYYPDEPNSLGNIGVTYLAEEKYTKAIPYFLRVEEQQPHNIYNIYNLAFSYKELDQVPEALHYYDLLQLHGNKKMRDEARNEMKKLMDRKP